MKIRRRSVLALSVPCPCPLVTTSLALPPPFPLDIFVEHLVCKFTPLYIPTAILISLLFYSSVRFKSLGFNSMDHTDNSKFNFPFNFPHDHLPQFQFDSPAESSDQISVPKPLECLQGNPVPPFLSKSYDLVDDPLLDPIISWGEKGNSFVVWEPADFATIVLPRCFKHANFSSFVRQLNTYGFRKIDTDKWEFANEFFLRGSKHLLKNIKRKRSNHPQQVVSEGPGLEMEMELEKLRTEKSVIMQEMAGLKQQHRETAERVESVRKRLQASEQKQKKMVSFIAKAVQNSEFMERVVEMKEQRLLECSSPRTRRKIVKQETQEQTSELATSMDEQIQSSEMLSSLPQQHYVVPESMPFSSDRESSDEFGTPQDMGYFVDFPEDLSTEKAITEFPAPFRKEEMLSMSNSMVDSWSPVGGYDFPVYEPFFSDGHLDTWDMQGSGISDMDKWQYGESGVGDL